MAVPTENRIITTMLRVAVTDRRIAIETPTISRNTIGVSRSRSSCVACANARCMTMSPVR